MDIQKRKVGTNVEYFLKDTDKTFWVFVDTSLYERTACVMGTQVVRMWAMNLGVYEVKEETEQSSFLDILLLTGLSERLLTDLFNQLAFGIIVSFCKGNIHQKQSVFDALKPGELPN
jgi:hypothetical protein